MESSKRSIRGLPPSPGFVEPEPQYFYTLSQIAFMAAEGLRERNLTGIFSSRPERLSLNGQLLELLDLADRLQRLGDIALRELTRGTTP